MKTIELTKTGQERYETFSPSHRPNQIFFQYDYRCIDGTLFSCIASSLKKCRIKLAIWSAKNNQEL